MANHEDFYYEIYNNIHSMGIADNFYKQLEKMKFQDKHKYKTNRDHWEYAYKKVTTLDLNENKGNEASKTF